MPVSVEACCGPPKRIMKRLTETSANQAFAGIESGTSAGSAAAKAASCSAAVRGTQSLVSIE